jgi:hypothetical protein
MEGIETLFLVQGGGMILFVVALFLFAFSLFVFQFHLSRFSVTKLYALRGELIYILGSVVLFIIMATALIAL